MPLSLIATRTTHDWRFGRLRSRRSVPDLWCGAYVRDIPPAGNISEFEIELLEERFEVLGTDMPPESLAERCVTQYESG